MKLTCLPYCLLLTLATAVGCSKDDGNNSPDPAQSMYFPPLSGTAWETQSIASLGWNASAVAPLETFLREKNTKSFMILVNGRIVMETYYNGHMSTTTWPWNSAGKTLTTAATGIAQQDGLLNINTPVSNYLGNGWTSAPIDKERLITPRHLITMTSGLNDASELVIKSNLTYLADAGTRWSYHNVFQKQMDVVAAVSGKTFDAYVKEKISDRIGLDGFWNKGLIFTVYHSTTRGMARFGLLALNQGNWNGTQVVPAAFFRESIQTSQSINPSYGYLWWLNGKTSYMVPNSQTVYPGALVPNAPADMYAAMGAEDQRIYVVPSRNMVVIRMGDASDPANPGFAVSSFDNTLWEKINAVIK
jgi:CubicO group peptidase (beta-lactamase class C family)